ncbi:Magnesium and cobalt efflux protein CorC [compost metagenome]
MGDLHDEFEDERPEIELLPDGSYSVDGRILLEEVNDLTGIEIEDDEVDSIGGWLFKELEGAPVKGKKVQVGRVLFEVAEATRLRITRIQIRQIVKVPEIEENLEQEKDN